MEIKKFNHLNYILSYPNGSEKSRKYPLVVFLHGAGTIHPTTELLEKNKVFLNLAKRQDERGFILLAPLCHAGTWFEHMNDVIELVDSVRNYDRVDITRVYVTGNSMGGYGTWELAALRPDWFAAAMPVCGGAMVWHTTRALVDVPVRTFHGLRDTTVDPIESLEAVKAINKNNGYAELILYPDLSHNCWDRVYTTEANYDWLFSFTTGRDKTVIEKLTGDYYG